MFKKYDYFSNIALLVYPKKAILPDRRISQQCWNPAYLIEEVYSVGCQLTWLKKSTVLAASLPNWRSLQCWQTAYLTEEVYSVMSAGPKYEVIDRQMDR